MVHYLSKLIENTLSFVLNLVPRNYAGNRISRTLKFRNFLGVHTSRPLQKKGSKRLFLIQLVTFFKPAGYFNFY